MTTRGASSAQLRLQAGGSSPALRPQISGPGNLLPSLPPPLFPLCSAVAWSRRRDGSGRWPGGLLGPSDLHLGVVRGELRRLLLHRRVLWVEPVFPQPPSPLPCPSVPPTGVVRAPHPQTLGPRARRLPFLRDPKGSKWWGWGGRPTPHPAPVDGSGSFPPHPWGVGLSFFPQIPAWRKAISPSVSSGGPFCPRSVPSAVPTRGRKKVPEGCREFEESCHWIKGVFVATCGWPKRGAFPEHHRAAQVHSQQWVSSEEVSPAAWSWVAQFLEVLYSSWAPPVGIALRSKKRTGPCLDLKTLFFRSSLEFRCIPVHFGGKVLELHSHSTGLLGSEGLSCCMLW